jgi:hypothetical protein
MPANYHIDTDKKRVFSSGSGHLTYEDLSGHMNRLAKDPKFDPRYSQLLDFRYVKTIGFNSEHVIELAEIRIFSPESKRAFVAPDAVKFGMARMYESYRIPKGDLKIQVFTDYDEAIEWLDLEEPVIPLAAEKARTLNRPPV